MRILLGLWVALLGLTGSLFASTPAFAADDPLYGAPEVGQCYDSTGATAGKPANPDDTVSCAQDHTLWILAVHKLPADVSLDPEDGELTKYFYSVCHPATKDAVGHYGDPAYAKSAYRAYFFVPTQAQQDQGARWISCELGIARGGRKLTTTDKRRPAKVKASMPDSLTLCANSKYTATACSNKHAYRVTYARVLTKRYTVSRARNKAQKICPSKVSTPNNWMWYVHSGVKRSQFVLSCLTHTAK
ncbi:septum formation family protein [Nocardioides acrostichi]|uniref:Septum formation family protein n=1 Tax=Nocardioides acrostichi TaxID=2784339 RepID=A0A930UXJ8_9ACTN|nr:septum formation family protein [Nocardioides acrostichi]MBF4160111.1 septum formation family protein [Nocardioides acrostichi]